MRQRSFEQLLEDQSECYASLDRPLVRDVFGFGVPTSLYLHRGHTWVALETCGRVRIGLDDFSQKVLGPADEMRLPSPGEKFQRDRVGLHLVRQGKKAAVLAPLDGVVEVVNPKVRQRPGLAHDDPYGEGWLCVVTPTNLKPDLEKLLFGQRNVAWIENEAHKLLGMLESAAGVTLPSGGIIIDDIYGHYPKLGWRRLVQELSPHRLSHFHRDRVGLHLVRQGKEAAVLAPLDGVVEVVNPRVRQRPALAHDDPYGEGWLCVVTPTNLKPDLENLLFGQRNAAWIENEAHKLLGMLESSAGVTLPSGGMIIDDIYGHYPKLGWRRLVQEFLRTA